MSTSSRLPPRAANQLLSALPAAEYVRLLPDFQSTRLTAGRVLYESGEPVGECYFAAGGMISLLSTTEDGSTIEISMVGNERLVGVPAVLGADATPYRVMVQIGSDALRIKASALKREFDRGETLHGLLLRYMHALLCQVSQSAVCNRFHTVEQRLCRWLLIGRDRVNSETFPLTQEFISHMLGVPRTSVTTTAATLQREGLISYTRGRITITDPRRLEARGCECYRVVRREIETLYAA